mmetsp:Transcript_74877/g.132229  ORF Transcript_74877/g.132229 Transcript_74877/m.132229 type:complete len:115 (-) Transcript_74877:67-411(-)
MLVVGWQVATPLPVPHACPFPRFFGDPSLSPPRNLMPDSASPDASRATSTPEPLLPAPAWALTSESNLQPRPCPPSLLACHSLLPPRPPSPTDPYIPHMGKERDEPVGRTVQSG